MKKKYLYNGEYYTEAEMTDFAKQSGVSFDSYIAALGKDVKVLDAPYEYKGNFYTQDEISAAAKKKGINDDAYLSQNGIKKKEEAYTGGAMSSAASKIGGQVGNFVGQSEKDNALSLIQSINAGITKGIEKGKQQFPNEIRATPEEEAALRDAQRRTGQADGLFTQQGAEQFNLLATDPLRAILDPEREKLQTAYNNRRLQGVRQTSDNTIARNNIDPNKTVQKKDGKLIPDVSSNPEYQVKNQEQALENVSGLVKNKFFKNGKEALEYAENQVKSGIDPTGNETIEHAITKAGEYKQKEESALNGKSIIQNAIEIQLQNDPLFKKQYETIINGTASDAEIADVARRFNIPLDKLKTQGSLPQEVVGELVHRFISDPDIKQIAEDNPEFKKDFDNFTGDKIYEVFPEYADVYIKNTLSRARELDGKNNWFANPIFDKSKYMDNLAEEVFKDRPILLKRVKDKFHNNWEHKIETTGIVDDLATGARGAMSGMWRSLKDVSGFGESYSDRIRNTLKEQYGHVETPHQNEFRKVVGEASNFMGMVLAMGATGSGLGNIGKGLGVMNPSVASKAVTLATFFDDELNHAASIYPENPTKAYLRASLSTAFFLVAGDAIPASKITGFKQNITQTLKSLETKALDKQAKMKLRDKILSVATETLQGTAKGTAEMTVMINGFKLLIDRALGLDESSINNEYSDANLLATAKSMLFGLPVPSMIHGFKGINRTRAAIYEMASNPEKYKSAILKRFGSDDHRIADIDFIADFKKYLDSMRVAENEKAKMVFNALHAKRLREQKSPDAFMKRNHEEEIRAIEQEQQDIMDGKDSDAGLTDSQKAIKTAYENGEINEMMEAQIKEALKDPAKADQFIKEIAEQATGAVAPELGNAKDGAIKFFGETLTDFAIGKSGKKDGGESVVFEYENEGEVPQKLKPLMVKDENGRITITMPKDEADALQKRIAEGLEPDMELMDGTLVKKTSTTEPVSPIPTEQAEALGEQVKARMGDQVSEGTNKEALEYAMEKVAEAPIEARKQLGDELFEKVLEATPTEKLQEGLDFLIDKNSDDPNVKELDRIISEREKKGSTPEQKSDWQKEQEAIDNDNTLSEAEKEEKKIESTAKALDDKYYEDKRIGKQKQLEIIDLIPKEQIDNPNENGFYRVSKMGDAWVSKQPNEVQEKVKKLNELFKDRQKEQIISEAYHKALKDGSNPELVKAVEELLSKEQATQEVKAEQPTVPQKESAGKEVGSGVGGEVKQKDLENRIDDINKKRTALRGEDGVVPADKMGEWNRLGKELKEAKVAASRGNSKSSILIKKRGESETSDPTHLSKEEKEEAADLIEQVIQNSKTVDEAVKKVNRLGYVFDLANANLFALYLSDRYNSDAPQVGNNKSSFQDWVNGKQSLKETPKAEAGSVGVGGDVLKGVNDKMRQTELEMEFKGNDAELSFKNNDVEIVVAKPIGADGKYSVTVSEKSDSNTGFTLNEGKTKLFDTKLEALEYAKKQKEQSLPTKEVAENKPTISKEQPDVSKEEGSGVGGEVVEGETKVVNGRELTFYNIKGRDDGSGFAVEKGSDGYVIQSAMIPMGIQRQGIGTRFYVRMNEESVKNTGNPLRSSDRLSNSAGKPFWENLVKNGYAEKTGDGYIFKSQQTLTEKQKLDREKLASLTGKKMTDAEFLDYEKRVADRIKSNQQKQFTYREIKEIAKKVKGGTVAGAKAESGGGYTTIFFHKYTDADAAISKLRKEGYNVSDRQNNPTNFYSKFKITVEKPVEQSLKETTKAGSVGVGGDGKRTAKAVSKRVAVEHAGHEGAKRVTGANENTLELDGYGTVSTSQFINTLVENGRLPKEALKNRHIQLTDEYATKLLNENSDLFPKENTETNKTGTNLPTFESAKNEYDAVKEKYGKHLKKDGGLRANTPDNVKKEIEDAYTKMQSTVKHERDKRVSDDKRDTGLIDGIERIKDNTSAFTLVRMAMNRGVIPERQFNEFGKNLLHIIADAKDSHEVTMQTAEIIQDFSQRANVKVDDALARELQAAENLKYEPVEQSLSTQEVKGNTKPTISKEQQPTDVSKEEGSGVGGDIRSVNDFANENESYRVIVGDGAFNDIVESGTVRTNAGNKGGESLSDKLKNRPTLFPSFSKGKASMEYAAENPNNYIIVTEDASIQPSKAGRHGKGTTMFPTDENGNHLKELSGEKVKVYKHIGEGQYVLVYANGKVVEQSLKETPKAGSVSVGGDVELTGEQVKNKLQEIEKQPVKINITQDANGKMEQTSQEVIDNIKNELDKTGLPYSDVVSNDKGSTYFVVTKDGQQHEILKVLQSGGKLVPTNLTKAKWINHLIKTEKNAVVKAVEQSLKETPPALRDVESTAKALEEVASKKNDAINSLAEKTGIFFHGSSTSIKEFDPKMMSMDYGHYLSINPSVSEGYGDVLHAINIKDGLKDYLNMEAEVSSADLNKLELDQGLSITGEEALIKSRNESGSNLSLEKYAESKGFKGEYYPSQKQITVFDGKTLEVKKSGEFKKVVSESIAEAYHKAKADGSNPELVKAVEELLGKPTEKPKTETTPNVEDKQTSKKQQQLEIINKTNPAPNDYNLWVRKVDDIKTAEEAFKNAREDGAMFDDFGIDDMQKAIETGEVTVYSSYPIENGVFVSPSRQNAQEYAGGKGGKLYSKKVSINDIAWLDEGDGQYAQVKAVEEALSKPNTNETTPENKKVEGNSALRDVESEKKQIEDFGVAKEDVEATHGLLGRVFDGLKKAGLTAAKTVGDWVGIGKGSETNNGLNQVDDIYHGSPHDFDKFSMNKIGTGEGAQAFGHGLYFTDVKGIAEEYARRLSKSNDLPTIDGKKADDWFRDNDLKAPYSKNYWMPELLGESKSKDDALKKIDIRIKSQEGKIDGYNDVLDDADATQNERAGARRALEVLETDLQDSYDLYNAVFRAKEYEPPSDKTRKLYKVSLHEGKAPEQYDWLEWDKDLPKSKIDKIKNALFSHDLPEGYHWDKEIRKEVKYVIHQIKDSKGNVIAEGSVKDEIRKKANLPPAFHSYSKPETREKEFDKIFTRPSDGKYTTGAGFYHRLSEFLGSDKAASDLLLKAGIDGVKYPAESIARGTTSDNARGFNYVVFDEKAITIKDKVLFSKEGNKINAQYRIESGKNIVEAIKDFDGSPRATVALTHEIMHPTVVAIIDGAKEGNAVGQKHTKTIVEEYNKANPDKKVTVQQMIEGNDAFINGRTTPEYRAVQEFIAEAWEKYHHEGAKGFSKAFQEVLDAITEVFRQVYKSLTGTTLTPELRKMFDELLGKENVSEVVKAPEISSKAKNKFSNLREKIKQKQSLKIVSDEAENRHANSKLTEADNPVQEPNVKALESEGENAKNAAQAENVIIKIDSIISAATDVGLRKVSDISTDEKRFQGRDKLNAEKVQEIAENWKDADQDPIHVWTDPKDGKTYVLSGHHRLAAAKQAGREKVKVIDRSKDFTEEQAIRFAKEEANANRTMETAIERANTLRQKRERGDTKDDINKFLDREGKNKNFVNNLSRLNPKGKTIEALRATEKSDDKVTQKEVEKIADWIGEARDRNKNLTDAHENELFDFLMDREGSKRITTKQDFLSKVNSLAGAMDFNANEPLNIARYKHKTEGEKLYDKEAETQKGKISDLQQRINEINDRIKNPNNPQYLNPDSKDYEEIKKNADNKLSELNTELQAESKALLDLYQQKGKFARQGTEQSSLFSTEKNETELPEDYYNDLRDIIKDLKDEHKGITLDEIKEIAKNELGEYYSEPDIEAAYKMTEPQPPKSAPEPPKSAPSRPDKSVLTNIVNAENTPPEVKKKLTAHGLKYDPESHDEALQIARAVIDSLGIDAAVTEARARNFGGAVNTFIQTEALNALYKKEAQAKTAQEKYEAAEKFAEVSIALDEWARGDAGRGISALATFYQKSPLGMVLKENKSRKEEFNQWAKGKEESWDEFLERLNKTPEFSDYVSEKVQTELREERKKERSKFFKKVDDTLDKWINDLESGNVAFSSVVPPKLIAEALKGVKAAFKVGESATKIIGDAIDYISDKIGDNWDKDTFRAKIEKALNLRAEKTSVDRYADSLKKQIEELQKQIDAGSRNKNQSNKRQLTPEEQSLLDEKKRLQKELNDIDPKTTFAQRIQKQIDDIQRQIDAGKRDEKERKNKKEYSEEEKELQEKLKAKKAELEALSPLKNTESYKLAELDKFREKLKGLSEAEKDEVVSKAYKKLLDNGALDHADLREIIAKATGRGNLTEKQAARLQELNETINAAEIAKQKHLKERTEQTLKEYHKAIDMAAKAKRDLANEFDKKTDYLKVISSSIQGNTLGLLNVAVMNPLYNITTHLALRLPIGTVQSLFGLALGKAEMNTVFGKPMQAEFFGKGGRGFREAFKGLLTGMNKADYESKEIFSSQIRPNRSLRALLGKDNREAKMKLQEKLFHTFSVFPGATAETNFRLLNFGDKPMRYSASAATAAAFAKKYGIKFNTMDWKTFMEFPREIVKEMELAKGKSLKEAEQEAEYVVRSIEKEGERSTMQQDNFFSDMLEKVFSGGKHEGAKSLAKTLTISPFVKIPSNVLWLGYNLVHPQIALAQAAAHTIRSYGYRGKGEIAESKLQMREARYWMSVTMMGAALQAVMIPLIKAGIITAANDEDDSKKKRIADLTYQPQGMFNMTKFWAYLSGKNVNEVQGGFEIPLKYFGLPGALGNSLARDYKQLTPEQKENRRLLTDNLLELFDADDFKDIENGIFSSSSSLLQGLKGGDMTYYAGNMVNLFTNLIQPAAVSEFSRAAIPYRISGKFDSLGDKIKNDLSNRSALFRKLTGKYPKGKRNIWGEIIKKDDSYANRYFGFNNVTKDNFAQFIYEDAQKWDDEDFLPPTVSNSLGGKKLTAEQLDELEENIGLARKEFIRAYTNDIALIEELGKNYSDILGRDAKKAALQYLYQKGRKLGVDMFVSKHPEFENVVSEEEKQVEELLKNFKEINLISEDEINEKIKH